MQKAKSFAGFLVMPESRSAWAAVRDLSAAVVAGAMPQPALVFLHGPPGTGKTHLVSALVGEVTRRGAGTTVTVLPAADLDLFDSAVPDGVAGDCSTQVRHNDLLIVEDLQHLSARGVEPLVQVLDYRAAWERPVLCTAAESPRRLRERLPTRLLSRLLGGLTVALAPWSVSSRRRFLHEAAQRRQLAISPEALGWLADNFRSNGRVLKSLLVRLETSARRQCLRLDMERVAALLHEETEAGRPTLERIAQDVSRYFRVEPRLLQSQRRHRNVLWPRQVSMYLARRLTRLSLERIGAYFGGRDHSTVLHACRKVEKAIQKDETLAGALCQLNAGLA